MHIRRGVSYYLRTLPYSIVLAIPLITWVIIVVAILIVLVLSTYFVGAIDIADLLRGKAFGQIVVPTMIGLVTFWIAIGVLHSRKQEVKQAYLPLVDRVSRPQVVAATIWTLVVCAILVWFSTDGVIQQAIDNPGGMFTILTGGATLVGVYLTLATLTDVRRTIRSFDDLMERLVDLVKTADRRAEIRFLAQTPAVGSLSLPRKEWMELMEVILHRLRHDSVRVQMVCLEETDLNLYHESFIGRVTARGKVIHEWVVEAQKNIDEVIRRVREEGGRVTRKAGSELPGYYLFSNDRKAIVVAPFFMPLPEHKLGRMDIVNLQTVEMFGFETSDRDMVLKVNTMFDLYHP